MKVKLPKELIALVMLVIGSIFASAIFEQGPLVVAIICTAVIGCGAYVYFAVIKRDDHADFDVIG